MFRAKDAAAINTRSVPRDLGLICESFRRRDLMESILLRAATGEETAWRCESGSQRGEDVLEAGSPFQEGRVAGEVGAYGRSAGFNTGPHDHVDDRPC